MTAQQLRCRFLCPQGLSRRALETRRLQLMSRCLALIPSRLLQRGSEDAYFTQKSDTRNKPKWLLLVNGEIQDQGAPSGVRLDHEKAMMSGNLHTHLRGRCYGLIKSQIALPRARTSSVCIVCLRVLPSACRADHPPTHRPTDKTGPDGTPLSEHHFAGFQPNNLLVGPRSV